ncbi:hypothetical protein RB653_010570 [Dictyostelium firmibasis]|uniref:Uncharacterized protein n=1 Tax=Dictyostelium firmibasis TaxID=79012 RepID=A0AAN7TK95_9MYCE
MGKTGSKTFPGCSIKTSEDLVNEFRKSREIKMVYDPKGKLIGSYIALIPEVKLMVEKGIERGETITTPTLTTTKGRKRKTIPKHDPQTTVDKKNKE